LQDKWKRQIAEYRNLQEQTKREVRAAKDFALQSFSRDLLDSIDNLDRALSVVPKEKLDGSNKDLSDLHSGLKMTETILMNTLKKHGLERFDPSAESDKFDPNMHEATFQTPQPDKQDGTVFFCQSKGFKLNGRVIRVSTATSEQSMTRNTDKIFLARQGRCCQKLIKTIRRKEKCQLNAYGGRQK